MDDIVQRHLLMRGYLEYDMKITVIQEMTICDDEVEMVKKITDDMMKIIM
ncbi:hypothetical protein J5751_00915 [bacterium]|nr:hypothetical protein [bacterium]